MTYRLSIMDCIYEGWQAFKKYPWLAMLIVALFTLIGYIPNLIIGDPAQTDPMSAEAIATGLLALAFAGVAFFIYPPLLGGYLWTFVKIARDDQPAFGNIFDGFRRYGSYLGFFLLFGGILIVLAIFLIVIAVVAGVSFDMASGGVGADTLTGPMVLLWMVVILIIGLVLFRFFPALMIFLDEPQTRFFDALSRSNDLLKGNYWPYLGLYIVTGLMGFAATVINWGLYLPFMQETIAEYGVLKVMEYPSILAIPVGAATTVMQAMGYVKLKKEFDKEQPPGIKPAPPGFVPPSDFKPSPETPPATDTPLPPPPVDDKPSDQGQPPTKDDRPKDEPPDPEKGA